MAASSSEPVTRRAGCGNSARPDPWGAGRETSRPTRRHPVTPESGPNLRLVPRPHELTLALRRANFIIRYGPVVPARVRHAGVQCQSAFVFQVDDDGVTPTTRLRYERWSRDRSRVPHPPPPFREVRLRARSARCSGLRRTCWPATRGAPAAQCEGCQVSLTRTAPRESRSRDAARGRMHRRNETIKWQAHEQVTQFAPRPTETWRSPKPIRTKAQSRATEHLVAGRAPKAPLRRDRAQPRPPKRQSP